MYAEMSWDTKRTGSWSKGLASVHSLVWIEKVASQTLFKTDEFPDTLSQLDRDEVAGKDST
jgi:hypothetical protein